MSPQEIIERITKSQKEIEFIISPGKALIFIGQLQLALRHPENKGASVALVREMIANMAQAIAVETETPEVLEVVAMGAHPEFDLTDEEAAEILGETGRSLSLSLDLKEGFDPEAVGKAMALLLNQTSDPEATFAQLQRVLSAQGGS